jgi:hypothetical protein
MLSGKRFRLGTFTMAVDLVDSKRVAVTIPGEAIIKVISGPRHGERMIDVLCDGRVVMMFAIDVEERGTERSSEVRVSSPYGDLEDDPVGRSVGRQLTKRARLDGESERFTLKTARARPP